MTPPQRRFGLPPPQIHVESLDRTDLVIAGLIRCRELETALDPHGFDDDETVRRIGWHLASRTGTDFRIGRRLLQLLSPDGYLIPPPEFRLARVTEPTELEMFQAPIVTPYRIELWQSGSTPAEWRVNGSVYHKYWEPRIWSRLRYLDRPWGRALTDDGWVRLGRRI
ncbi:hypothetical protein [Rhizobium sp. Root1204]|uniref:hypothetical protein n=1 Tax=Rhizobium sp. Root1204 TaxID=1736428 RepID=UPI00071295B4|nr:hypothetical protein [Rhizobium sp. Root1204]KQV41940.1 hypothetical protein ASC96_00840 [Rhizobium sp. Root1204]